MAEPGRASSARVDVLTAEVRVLMVGSRQVTLSVYNQLDRVALVAMTPFGRVSVKRQPDPDDPWDHVDLVGADGEGILVASWFARHRYDHACADPGGRWRNAELAGQTWDEVQALPLIVLAGLR